MAYSYDVHNPAIDGLASYAKGRRTRSEVTGGAVVAYDSFDPLGRVTRSRQAAYRFGDDTNAGYEYLRNGALSKQRLPSARVLTWTYDDAGRPTKVSDGTTDYVTAVTYADHGAVGTMRLNGQRIRESLTYDANRLQLMGSAVAKCSDNTVACSSPSAVLSLAYGYSTGAAAGNGNGPDNNGNPRSQDITAPGMAATVRQSYTYDNWSRLKTFSEGPVGGAAVLNETYCFDEYGNRAVQTRTGLSPMTPQVTNCAAAEVRTLFPGNRISGMSYDAGGGVGTDGRSQFRYNAEDLVAQSWPAVGTATLTTYEYDGDNRRVAMVTGGARTSFVYDAGGALAAEYDGSPSPITGTSYVHVDALGSTRLVTDAAGEVRRRVDYWPYGEEIYGGQTTYRTAGLGYAGDNEPRVKFTGKERDAETGLDYFGARYLSGAQGRFTSPDAPLVDQHAADPQSWNLYSYVRNNPLRNIDPNGHDCVGAVLGPQSAESCVDQLIGGAMAVGNIPSGIVNTPAHVLNTLIGPFTDFQFPDAVAQTFTPSNESQREGMAAANAVMLVSPIVEAVAGKIASMGRSSGTAEIVIDSAKSPQAAAHIQDAQAAGHPSVVTLDRGLAKPNRKAALADTPTAPKGMSRDEYPPACCREGGAGSSVRAIRAGDNSSAGAQFGNQARGLPDGTKVRIKVK